MKSKELSHYLNELLDVPTIQDASLNGLQVENEGERFEYEESHESGAEKSPEHGSDGQDEAEESRSEGESNSTHRQSQSSEPDEWASQTLRARQDSGDATRRIS